MVALADVNIGDNGNDRKEAGKRLAAQHFVGATTVVDHINARRERGEVDGGGTVGGARFVYEFACEVIDENTCGGLAHGERLYTVGLVDEGDLLHFGIGEFQNGGFASHAQHIRFGERHYRLRGKGKAKGALCGSMDVQGLLGRGLQAAGEEQEWE